MEDTTAVTTTNDKDDGDFEIQDANGTIARTASPLPSPTVVAAEEENEAEKDEATAVATTPSPTLDFTEQEETSISNKSNNDGDGDGDDPEKENSTAVGNPVVEEEGEDNLSVAEENVAEVATAAVQATPSVEASSSETPILDAIEQEGTPISHNRKNYVDDEREEPTASTNNPVVEAEEEEDNVSSSSSLSIGEVVNERLEEQQQQEQQLHDYEKEDEGDNQNEVDDSKDSKDDDDDDEEDNKDDNKDDKNNHDDESDTNGNVILDSPSLTKTLKRISKLDYEQAHANVVKEATMGASDSILSRDDASSMEEIVALHTDHDHDSNSMADDDDDDEPEDQSNTKTFGASYMNNMRYAAGDASIEVSASTKHIFESLPDATATATNPTSPRQRNLRQPPLHVIDDSETANEDKEEEDDAVEPMNTHAVDAHTKAMRRGSSLHSETTYSSATKDFSPRRSLSPKSLRKGIPSSSPPSSPPRNNNNNNNNYNNNKELSPQHAVQVAQNDEITAQEILRSCGVLPVSLAQLSLLHRVSQESIIDALCQRSQNNKNDTAVETTATTSTSSSYGAVRGGDTPNDAQHGNNNNHHHNKDNPSGVAPRDNNTELSQHFQAAIAAHVDDEVLLLHSLFANFCTPPPSVESVSQMLQSERKRNNNSASGGGDPHSNANGRPPRGGAAAADTSTSPTFLPKDSLLSVAGADKSSVITLLCNEPEHYLLKLPKPFQMAFFRILIRLLTNETDEEYDLECLLTIQAQENDDFSSADNSGSASASATQNEDKPDQVVLDTRNFDDSFVSDSGHSSDRSLDFPRPQSTNDFKKATQERIDRIRKERQALERKRSLRLSWVDSTKNNKKLRMSNRSKGSRQANQIYTLVRFRSSSAWNSYHFASSTSGSSNADGTTQHSQNQHQQLHTHNTNSNASSNLDDGRSSAVTLLLQLLELILKPTTLSTTTRHIDYIDGDDNGSASNSNNYVYTNDHLIAPVSRLLGLSCTAGVSVRELRRILMMASGPLRGEDSTSIPPLEANSLLVDTSVNGDTKSSSSKDHKDISKFVQLPAFARLLLVRAISTAAEGASQSSLLVGKASPRHFFTFGRGPGIVRNMRSLSAWPFRNDFGMALWFRAESFDSPDGDDPTLLSIRAETGGGIEVSLLPERSSSGVATVTELAVTVYDSNSSHMQNVVLKGCVLLPRVWYHVAVRHTRSRLKGVFSLATRQHVSVMIDGKVMLTEPLHFPKITEAVGASKILPMFPSSSQKSSKKETGLNVRVVFGSNFDGQTGALYVFNDHISESSLKTLAEVTAGTGGIRKKEQFSDNMWDNRRGEMAQRSMNDVELTKADVEEIVVKKQHIESNALPQDPSNIKAASSEVIDLGEGDAVEESHFPPELLKASFGSKLFLVWDPKRTENSVTLELHSGAHASMDMDTIQPWYLDGAKTVIASIGGVQAILPVLNANLSGDVERMWQQSQSNRRTSLNALDRAALYSLIPDLMWLVASFIRDHAENAREMLRCGGIDIIEQLLQKSKNGVDTTKREASSTATAALPKRTLMSVIHDHDSTAQQLVDSLLDLRTASSHDVLLETKVFSRLLFNVPLWLGGTSDTCGVALHAALLPTLSDFAMSSPKKVRDCVGVKEMVESLRQYTGVGSSTDLSQFADEPETGLFDRSTKSRLRADAPLTIKERRHVIDIILAIVSAVMSPGISPMQVAPFLDYVSFNLDSEWEQASAELQRGDDPEARSGSREEVFLTTKKACMILLFLLQSRPVVDDLFESLALCCGSEHGFASWILSAMVNSFDDSMRSLGVRCLHSYLNIIAPNADSVLNFSAVQNLADAVTFDEDGTGEDSAMGTHTAVRMVSQTMIKGLAAIGSTGVLSGILPSTKQSVQIVYKLLWHLLKCHRTRIGPASHSALVQFLLDDRALFSSSASSLLGDFVIRDDILRSGFKLNKHWTDAVLADASSISNQRLRDTPALSSVLRLLRFLPASMKEKWLYDLQSLVTLSTASLNVLVASPDWQPSLFLLISEIVEELNTMYIDEDEESSATPANSATNDLMEDVKNLDLADKTGEISTYAVQSNDTAADTKEVPTPNTKTRSKEFDEAMSNDKTAESGGKQSLVQTRFSLALKLYSTLLGHQIRQGGDSAFHAVEQAASLQRVCVNGSEVFSLILSHLLVDLMENGTVLGIEFYATTANAPLDERNRLLKQSARVVTNAILTNGADGMDMPAAVRHWRCLRHLTAVIVAVITNCGFGVAELFDYRNQHASALDVFSGGLHGIRLADGNVPGIEGSEYILAENLDDRDRCERENFRRVCVTLSAQLLSLLDAFIFPDSLDASLPASQLHGLALVRTNEPRLGLAQGPLLASLIRLSLLLLCHLEPSSVKFLQCCSRLRCFVHWTLELIRESVALAGYSAAFHTLTAPLDRMVLAVVLHSHRTLARCSAVLYEIEASSYRTYFSSEEAQKKAFKRLFRVAFELREIILAAFRGRNEVLRLALSYQAFESLKASLEKTTPGPNQAASEQGNRKLSAKETAIRTFLSSAWVTGFHDIDMHEGVAVPEQVSSGQVHEHRTASHRGRLAIEELASESDDIIDDFNRGLNAPFEDYCENQRRWAETDAVRDLEFIGDTTVQRLSKKHTGDLSETRKFESLRLEAAKARWDVIEHDVNDLWTNGLHWKLSDHTDRLDRRILFVRNRAFEDHEDASYEKMLESEREKALKEREERLRRKKEEELSAVVRRNEEAFVPYGEADEVEADMDDENPDSNVEGNETEDSDSPSMERRASLDGELDVDFVPKEPRDAESIPPDTATDSDWDEVNSKDVALAQTQEKIDSDAWAKAFIWSESESVVARFGEVTVVTLQTLTEGRLLLTTHGLYFHPTGDDINVMTKERFVRKEKDQRWRLSRLTEVHGRRYMLRAQALEMFFSDTHELFVSFSGGTRERDRFYAKLRNSCKVPLLSSPKSLNPRTVFKKSKLKDLWKKRKISNFQYLMHLNFMAGRSFNDITQYPVFPWVLADYTSETIDLNDSRVYRDLTKPVGALNPDRLAQLIARYNDLESFGFSEQEKFLYGSHYSSPGVVLHFLIRQEPFTTMAIELQSGRFDCPDRLFFDVAGCWKSCMTSTSDVKELVPEFFTCPEVFLNNNRYPLGQTQDKRSVDNVFLPPWAKGSVYEFVRIHRLALESEYVSQNINHWIDLIFGYKQRGPEAEAAHNVFHYLSYEGAVDLDKITDEIDRVATESHIQNFGQTPCQLLVNEPHLRRYSVEECWRSLIYNMTAAKSLRCHTSGKQFGGKRSTFARGSVLSLHAMTDTIVAVYADLSIGTYKWSIGRNGGSLKMDRHRKLASSYLSTSRAAIKRGSAAPQSMESSGSSLAVGNWSFAFTLGGRAKENLKRTSNMSRLNPSKDTLAGAEVSSLFVSSGYWDNTVKVHSIEGMKNRSGEVKLRSSENGGHRGPILCLDIGRDGALMVTGGQDATCRVWVVDHPDMSIALSDGYVKTALGGTAENNKDHLLSCCHILWGHETAVTCFSLSSDLDITVSGSIDGTICVHTVRRGKFVRSIRLSRLSASRQKPAVRKIVLDDHGTFVAHTEDGGLHAYTINGAFLCLADAGEKLHDMAICTNGEILVTGGDSGHVVIRSVRDLAVTATLDLSRHGPIRCISMTPEELNPIPQYMFIGSDDGMVSVVDRDPSALTIAKTETVTFS